MTGPIKTYDIHLPVWKQGDDFDHCLEHHKNDPVKAFQSLADQYLYAAKMCNRVSEVLAMAGDLSEVSAQGITHSILITAPEKLMEVLVKEEIAELNTFHDDEEEEEFDMEDEENAETQTN